MQEQKKCMERLPVCPQVWETGEEAMVSVVCSYDDLSRKLWNLKELPLTVTAVQGVHPALRYTDVSVLGQGGCRVLEVREDRENESLCGCVAPESPWGNIVPLLCCSILWAG